MLRQPSSHARNANVCIGTCKIDISVHRASMFRILINIYMPAVIPDFGPQEFKKMLNVQETNTHTHTHKFCHRQGKGSYIKKIYRLVLL